MDTKNRLQFRHHDQVFDTREAAIEYIQSQIRFAEEGLAAEDSRYGYSLLAEPTVLLYKNETEQDPTGEDNPHLIIALGSKTNDGTQYSDNRFCIIDIDKTEQEIADLAEELEKAIKSLTLIALSSDTLNFYAEKTDEGTYVSGDVKVAESHIFDDVSKKNNLMVTPEGLFIYVNLEYDPDNEQFTFTVSNADGTLTQTTVDFSDNYLIGGYYDKTDESIHLQMKDGEEVVVDCEELIAEWGVEGEASRTPVVLTREEVDYDHTDEHYHVEPWQDVLRADVRIKDETKELQPNGTYKYEKDPRSTNILDRTTDGRYLYVDGKASNIIYYMNGEKSTVKAALDELQKIKLSSDSDNILINKVDGFFASSKLEYISSANKLIFKTSGHPDKEIQLNSVELFERVYYDPTREVLVLTYKDSTGQTQFVEIPIGEMIRDWEWEPQNEGHNVKIVKKRNVSGNDKVSADVKIYDDPDNILVDKNHELFVKGTADNIKYENGTVKDALDAINDKNEEQDDKLDELDGKIGSGFTNDPHDNVTYKFEQLQTQVNDVADNLQNEIDRSTAKDEEHDGKIQAIEDEIGDGFGPRNTVRDEIDDLQDEIDELSAQTASKLQDINSDNSINIDKTEPTVPVISVNLSEEVEHGKENIIKLNNDGLYAGVDLSYVEEANKLIFSTTNGEKEIQLESMSSIISIEYNPTKEAIVITYMTNGHEIKTVEIPVGDLINEWRVEDGHPHAVALEKVRIASGTSEQDVLKASVIITDDHDDNILVMDDGALYVPGGQIEQNAQDIADLKDRMDTAEADIDNLEAAAETAECVKNELKAVEKAVLGHIVGEECGSGYTYEQNNMATYINSAVSFYNADFILDQNIKRVEIYVDEVSAKTDCVDGKADAIYKLLYGENQTMPDCGEGAEYHPYPTACVLSAATSFSEADQLLNDQICQILTMWVSGITCTNESSWIEDGMNRKLQVDTRLSHGNLATMQDENLYITTLNGDYIDPTNNEFTDTNALRIICLEEGPSGVTPSIDTKQNGIYLSNVWDCGLYYGTTAEDAEAKAKAQAAGYNTNYSTDEDSSASNYMNNARQLDTLC